MKFKVGDKVKVICEGIHYFPVGNIVEIVAKYPDGSYEAYGYGENKQKIYQNVEERDIELVKDDTQVKHHAPIVYKIYEELKKHVGKQNAIPAKELCEIFEDELIVFDVTKVDYKCADRKLREIMREIRRSPELEKIPCSCNKGYYFAAEREEAEEAIDRLVNAAKNELKTAYTMAKKLGLEGQMKIPFGKYWSDTYHSLMEKDDESDTETD